MKQAICLAVTVVLLAVSACGDVVTLKNGERLVGSWVSVQGGNLTFKSDSFGQLTVPLSKVQSFSTSTPGVITRKDKSTAGGQLELLHSGDWRVTQKGKTQTVTASSIDIILPETAYTALTTHQAAPWQDWKGAANFGYNLQRGDQQTGTISANVVATRDRPESPIFIRHFRTNYGLVMLFSKAQQNGALIRSNTITTNLRQDYLFAPNDFVFGSAELDHIQAQGLYLRQIYGGGLGRDIIHSPRTVFSVLAGLTFVNEKFYAGGPAQQSAETLLGETLSIALTPRIHLDHSLTFYPNLTNTGEYHFDTASGLSLKLTSRIFANISLVDNYLSNPTPGNHKNNVALTTGLGLTF